MNILYKKVKEFTLLELKELYLSIGWNIHRLDLHKFMYVPWSSNK